MRNLHLSRRSMLRGAVGAAAAATLGPFGWTTPASAAVTVTKVKDLVGNPGPSVRDVVATDLGIPVRVPGSSSKILYIFGDSFSNAAMTQNWRSPIGLISETPTSLLPFGVSFNSAIGDTPTTVKQLIPYTHSNNGLLFTVLPTDVLDLNGTLWMWTVMLGTADPNSVKSVVIFKSTDGGKTWASVNSFSPTKDGGFFQMCTWAPGDNDYVYLFTTGFQRNKALRHYRVKKANIGVSSAYEPWGFGPGGWAYGNPATDIMQGRIGEMCLRPIGNKWLFTFLDVKDMANPFSPETQIKAAVIDLPTSDLVNAPKTTLITNTAWTSPQTGTRVSQPYGCYIIPGSTLSDFHMVVSQWNTSNNSTYRSMQFRVRGIPQ